MTGNINKQDYLNAENEYFNNADNHRWAEMRVFANILNGNMIDGDGSLVNTEDGDYMLGKINVLSEKRRVSVLSAKSEYTDGICYFVAENGDDGNDGRTPETPWKTLSKVSGFEFKEGDTVLFNRGDIFRGSLRLKNGVTYSAYGEGEKPKLFGSPENGACPEKWSLLDGTDNIWVYETELTDVGLVVFNDGEEYTTRVPADFIESRFRVRGSEDMRPFDVKTDLADLQTFSCCDSEIVNGLPTRNSKGKLYLRCDRGNPAEVFSSIEFNTCGNILIGGDCRDVTVDNLCIKYGGSHGIGAGHVKNFTVKNCEIGWIGGSVQLYNKTTGVATLYGNGIEVYGSCDGYYVLNNYIYQCFDAGITHQQGPGGTSYEFKNVVYSGNLVEDCIYSIEYFMSAAQDSKYTRVMKNVLFENNILRRAGYGFGKQRPNDNFATNILGWWTSRNEAENFVIKDNIFDRSARTLLQINAEEESFLPKLENNTYLQNTDKFFGRIGFDNKTANYYSSQAFYRLKIKGFIGSFDSSAKVYFVK